MQKPMTQRFRTSIRQSKPLHSLKTIGRLPTRIKLCIFRLRGNVKEVYTNQVHIFLRFSQYYTGASFSEIDERLHDEDDG